MLYLFIILPQFCVMMTQASVPGRDPDFLHKYGARHKNFNRGPSDPSRSTTFKFEIIRIIRTLAPSRCLPADKETRPETRLV